MLRVGNINLQGDTVILSVQFLQYSVFSFTDPVRGSGNFNLWV